MTRRTPDTATVDTRSKPARDSGVAAALEKAATRLPGVAMGVACKGTTLESRTFITAKKAFLFIGARHARLKLASAVTEATALAQRLPEVVQVGAGGWTRISLVGDAQLTPSLLTRWVMESHGLFAQHQGRGGDTAGARRSTIRASAGSANRPRSGSDS